MDKITESLVTILVGLTGVAILAVIVSKRSNTSGVIGAIFGGYAKAVGAAVSPITGGNATGTGVFSSSGSYLDGFPSM
jgi:PRD1 phage membrane DNA delivery